MDEAVNAFLDFNKHAEVCEVANFCSVARADSILLFDVLPRVVLELLDAKAHLAVFAVESEDNCFNLVANLEEVLSAAEVLAPRHF